MDRGTVFMVNDKKKAPSTEGALHFHSGVILGKMLRCHGINSCSTHDGGNLFEGLEEKFCYFLASVLGKLFSLFLCKVEKNVFAVTLPCTKDIMP